MAFKQSVTVCVFMCVHMYVYLCVRICHQSVNLVVRTSRSTLTILLGGRGTHAHLLSQHLIFSVLLHTLTSTCSLLSEVNSLKTTLGPLCTLATPGFSQGDSNKHLVEERPVLLDKLEQPGFESERNPPHPGESRQS